MQVNLLILSPARRPVQVTQDLANFWRSTYAEVKKDPKGRSSSTIGPTIHWPKPPPRKTPQTLTAESYSATAGIYSLKLLQSDFILRLNSRN
jgi:HrpA-like RNA helicase